MTKEQIIKAIGELFGDQSVSPRATLAALEEIRDDIDSRIDALESDLSREEE